ncbi:MAG: Crp/Fnr family transcriptional regulator [Saprospiraceae bacterium]|nr:Crp/Fnr family transcriptional regulator [Saprospiraceae bacterium]
MNVTTGLSFLKQFPLFQILSEAEFDEITRNAEYRVFPKYGHIYLADDASDQIFFLLKGVVKVGTHSEEGREVIKTILHPSAMFGELGLVGEDVRPEFARAMNQEVHCYSVPVAAFRDLMRSNFELCQRVLSLVGSRLRHTEDRLEALIFKDARTRIIDFLKECANKRGRKVGFEMLFKHCLTQQDIANLTGTSRQTVTSVLNELRKENLIYFNRRSILIRDIARLT